jgi:hypothetical protein
MSPKEQRELAKLNALVKAIDKVVVFGLGVLDRSTLYDLGNLRGKLHRRRKELIQEPDIRSLKVTE